MSISFDNVLDRISFLAKTFDNDSVVMRVGDAGAVVCLPSRFVNFSNVHTLPDCTTFTALLASADTYNNTCIRSAFHGITPKNYRKVDSSHINKLHNLVDIIINEVTIHGVPALSGVAALPDGFVIATALNKTAAGSAFDKELGLRYLKEDLMSKIDDRLWELEGYRVFRAVNTLDSISRKLPDGDKAIHLLANGAAVHTLPDVNYVILSMSIPPDTTKSFHVLDTASYHRIVSIIDTYIERG